MRYLEVRKQLTPFIVFSIDDFRKVDPHMDRRRLTEWQEKKYIQKVRRGYYIFTDSALNESTIFLIANRIYQPSYISFETALSYYHFIPESVFALTSATSRKAATFTASFGTFVYHALKASQMFGYALLPYGSQRIRIAYPEKAIIDYLHFRRDLKTEDDFLGLRMNRDVMRSAIKKTRFVRYLRMFGSASLQRRVGIFLKTYHIV